MLDYAVCKQGRGGLVRGWNTELIDNTLDVTDSRGNVLRLRDERRSLCDPAVQLVEQGQMVMDLVQMAFFR